MRLNCPELLLVKLSLKENLLVGLRFQKHDYLKRFYLAILNLMTTGTISEPDKSESTLSKSVE